MDAFFISSSYLRAGLRKKVTDLQLVEEKNVIQPGKRQLHTDRGREGQRLAFPAVCERHAGLPRPIPPSLGELVACCAYETVSQRNATWMAAKCYVEKNAKNQVANSIGAT